MQGKCNLLEAVEDMRLRCRLTIEYDRNPNNTARATIEWFTAKDIYGLTRPS